MALYIPHSIFHLARLLYVTPETFGPYYICTVVQQPLVHHGLIIIIIIIEASRSYSDTPQSVGLLWTSDQPNAGTSN